MKTKSDKPTGLSLAASAAADLRRLKLNSAHQPRLKRGLLLVFLLLALGASLAQAATVTWTNTGGGNWNTAANWSPNKVPAAADTALITQPGTYTVKLDTSATIASLTLGDGSGQQRFTNSANTLTVSGSATIAANGVLDWAGGSLSGAGQLQVNSGGVFNWFGGDMTKALTVGAGGVVNLGGTVDKTVYQPWTNWGTINWLSRGLSIYNNGSSYRGAIYNQAGALFDVQCDQSLGYAYGQEIIRNSGTFRKSAAAGATTIQVAFTNTGTVLAQSGTLNWQGIYTQTEGLTLLTNGNLAASSPLRIHGGTLAGKGTITGSVTNNGVVSPGVSPGQLTITGEYTQTTNGVLNIELAGTTAGTGYDRLGANTAARLAGTLNVTLANGFYPETNALFTFLTTTTRSGTFSTFNYPSNDVGLQLNHGATVASVRVINVRPELAALPDVTLNELDLFNHTATATDADRPAQTLTFWLTNSPPGASIHPGNGLITWTPTEEQGPMTTNLIVCVTDSGTPPLTVRRTFAVAVNEINTAPLLTVPTDQVINEQTALSLHATASDADLPANPLTFSLVSGPAGLAVSPEGAITWTPTEAQGSNSYLVAVAVTDSSPDAVNAQQLSVTNHFTITVNEVNLPPTLVVPTNQVVIEETLLAVAALASDADLPPNALTYELLAPPAGAGIDPDTGAITWTPTEAQGSNVFTLTVRVTDLSPLAVNQPQFSVTNSFQVTVTESNRPPGLTVPDTQTLDELTSLAVSASATDADWPTNGLTFGLVAPPEGMTLDPASGAITWTPTEAQGSNTYTITVTVTDTNATALNAQQLTTTNTFEVVVNEVNVAPVLPDIADQTLNEGTVLTVVNTATDADLPANPLTYQLLDPPDGASVDAAGVITWTPTEAQGSNCYMLTVVVTDTNRPAVNQKAFSVTNRFTVTVTEVNEVPVLEAIADRQVNPGQTVAFTASATDPDLPANGLTFALVSAPTGATLDAANGAFTWRPGVADADTTNQIRVRVADDGSPSRSATQAFTVVVVPLAEVRLTPVLAAADQFIFEMTGQAGPDYTVLVATNLATPDWGAVLTTNLMSSPALLTNTFPAGSAAQRFYRVLIGP